MLDDYKEIDLTIYKQMKKSLNNNLSHAYLFDLNNNIYAEDMILSFVKNILCGNHKSKEEYEKCPICNRIDDGNYPELKKIYPDGQVIKKEQLYELQKEFSTKAIESEKKVYIIYDAEKLNASAANSLLKFLEEPPEGIVAILLTNSSNRVLGTILSRCQILKFSNSNVEEFIKYNKIKENQTYYKIAFSIFGKTQIDDSIKIFVDSVIDFWKLYENNKKNTILYEKKYFLDIFNNKDDILKFINSSIIFYRDVINYKLNRDILYYNDYENDISNISSKNSLDKLLHKLKVLLKKEKIIKTNVNLNMFIDGVIIDMEE